MVRTEGQLGTLASTEKEAGPQQTAVTVEGELKALKHTGVPYRGWPTAVKVEGELKALKHTGVPYRGWPTTDSSNSRGRVKGPEAHWGTLQRLTHNRQQQVSHGVSGYGTVNVSGVDRVNRPAPRDRAICLIEIPVELYVSVLTPVPCLEMRLSLHQLTAALSGTIVWLSGCDSYSRYKSMTPIRADGHGATHKRS
ncbi:hypothetical protein ACOMHN_027185 [Nucella lapillus]